VTGRNRHPKKEVEQALQYSEENRWTVEQTSSGHKWGVARCGQGCKVSIWSTPRNPGNHAKQVRRAVDRCPTSKQRRRTPMLEHNFTLIIDGDAETKIDALFEAGCNDATFGSIDGVHYAEFDREASTLGEAIFSAVANVESVPGLRVRHVEPDDLVTASEIAERLGRTRESVRLIIGGKRGSGEFPAPYSHLRCRNRLWRWSEVAEWVGESSKEEATRAHFIAAVNALLELRSNVPELPETIREHVAAWGYIGFHDASKEEKRGLARRF
jgi:hypothetical protein